MILRSILPGAALALLPALASAQVELDGAVARVASTLAQTASVYLSIRNHSDRDDRLVRVEGDIADRIEIHTTAMTDDGVMRMVELVDGIAIPGGEIHALLPGGDHLMLLGLTEPLEQGDTFDLLLFFDVTLPITVTVTVDNAAANALAEEGAMQMDMDRGGDDHGTGHGSGD